MLKVKLERVAHCRSGDKGNTSNISVIAYRQELYESLKSQLNERQFQQHYAGVILGKVTRYSIDQLCALNFVCEGALGGGGFSLSMSRQLWKITKLKDIVF